jgi:hypothetical protein
MNMSKFRRILEWILTVVFFCITALYIAGYSAGLPNNYWIPSLILGAIFFPPLRPFWRLKVVKYSLMAGYSIVMTPRGYNTIAWPRDMISTSISKPWPSNGIETGAIFLLFISGNIILLSPTVIIFAKVIGWGIEAIQNRIEDLT